MVHIEDAIRNRRSSENHFDQVASQEDERILSGLIGQQLMDDRADWETDVGETPDGAYGLNCEVRWLAHPENTVTIRAIREGNQ